MEGVMNFRDKVMFIPCYIGPYKFLRKFRNIAYELDLPVSLALVYPVFHMSMLKKCMGDTSHIVTIGDFGVYDYWLYEKVPIEILDRQV